jgi:hypothetical protein
MLPKNHESDVNPKRLIDCADMILAEGAKCPQGISLNDLRVAAEEHGPGGDTYSAHEITAAMCFLFRMGYAVPKPARR